MTVKRYMVIDLVFFSILLIISECSNQFLKMHLESKIYFSFSFFILGIMLIRWRKQGLLAALISSISITPILTYFLESPLWKMALLKVVPVLMISVLLLVLEKLEKKSFKMSLVKKLLFFIILFFIYGIGESLVEGLIESKDVILSSAEFIYEHSLSLFATIVVTLLFSNHVDLLVNQRRELEHQYEKHRNHPER